MKHLVQHIRNILAKGSISEELVHAIQDVTMVAVPNLQKQVAHREYEPGRYLLYKDPDYGFVVMMLVWSPGQCTPIHDHGVWGIEAVLKNWVRVTSYTNCTQSPKETGSIILPPGSVAYVLPPDADIHQVAHYGEGQAITIHIYGRELKEGRFFVPGEGYKSRSLVCKELKIDFDLSQNEISTLDFQI